MSEAEVDPSNTWPSRNLVNGSMNQRGTREGSQWAMQILATVLVTGIVASNEIDWPQNGGPREGAVKRTANAKQVSQQPSALMR